MFIIITLSSYSIDSCILEKVLLSLVEFVGLESINGSLIVEKDISEVTEISVPLLDVSYENDLTNNEKLSLMTEICNGYKSSKHIEEQKLTFETACPVVLNEFAKKCMSTQIKALIVIS